MGLFAMTPDLLLAFAWVGGARSRGGGASRAPAVERPCRGGARCSPGLLAGRRVRGEGRRRPPRCSRSSSTYLSRALRARTRGRSGRGRGSPLGARRRRADRALRGAHGVAHAPPPARRHADAARASRFETRARSLGGQLVYLSPLLLVACRVVALALVARAEIAATPTASLLYARSPSRSRPRAPLPLEPRRRAALARPGAARAPAPRAPRRMGSLVAGARPLASRARRLGVVTGLRHARARVGARAPRRCASLPASADPALDIANELVRVADGVDVVRASRRRAHAAEAPDDVRSSSGRTGSSARSSMPRCDGDIPVGCDDDLRDDFDDWLPRAAVASSADTDRLRHATTASRSTSTPASRTASRRAHGQSRSPATGASSARFRVALPPPARARDRAALRSRGGNPPRSAAGGIARRPASRMSARSVVLARVRRRQQLVAVEDRVRAGEEAQHLRLARQLRPPRAEAARAPAA